MRRFSYKTKLHLFLLGIPMALAFIWSAPDVVRFLANTLKIRELEILIKDRQSKKGELVDEITRLQNGDPACWKRVYRQEAHALAEDEVEYRFR